VRLNAQGTTLPTSVNATPGALSNADIAQELVVSDATVKTHVARIFAKLDLHDRAQAVVFAYETGVVHAGQ